MTSLALTMMKSEILWEMTAVLVDRPYVYLRKVYFTRDVVSDGGGRKPQGVARKHAHASPE